MIDFFKDFATGFSRGYARSIMDQGYLIKTVFVPQKDITAYELAQIVANLSGLDAPKYNVTFEKEKWDNLAPELKRHFKVKELKEVY